MALDNTSVSLGITTGETTAVGIANNKYPITYSFAPSTQITSGTGANAAQKVATVSASVGTGGTSYDVTALVGGPAGATVNFTKAKIISIENTDLTNTLTITTSGSNGWTNLIPSGVLTLPAGGLFFLYIPSSAGIATASNNKVLAIASGASTVAFKMVIVGEGS